MSDSPSDGVGRLEDRVQAVLQRKTKKPGSGKSVFLAVEDEDGEVRRVGYKYDFPGHYALVREDLFEEDDRHE